MVLELGANGCAGLAAHQNVCQVQRVASRVPTCMPTRMAMSPAETCMPVWPAMPATSAAVIVWLMKSPRWKVLAAVRPVQPWSIDDPLRLAFRMSTYTQAPQSGSGNVFAGDGVPGQPGMV